MAFFDDFGKKLSQASQSAVQKTKDITEVAKINGMISDEEKKLNNCYFQIGKLYVQLHRNNCEAEFVKLMEAVCQSEAKIADYRKRVQDIKGIIRCSKCGAELANTAAFCNACGTAVQKQAPAPVSNESAIKVKCSSCGTPIGQGMRFCTACGTPVSNTAPGAAPVAEPTPSAAPVVDTPVTPEKPAGRVCPTCGNQVCEGMFFCTECGTNIV